MGARFNILCAAVLVLGALPFPLAAQSALSNVVSSGSPKTGGAELYQKGMKALDAKNNDEAFQDFKKSAELGDANGENSLGMCYTDGTGVTADYPEAVKWFRKSAAQGNPLGEGNLGICYLFGQGVRQDENLAQQWVAKSNDRDCESAMGYYYFKNQAYPKAVDWLQKSANQGSPFAQVILGQCYEGGKGVPQDLPKAKYWYQKAVDQGGTNLQWAKGYLDRLSNVTASSDSPAGADTATDFRSLPDTGTQNGGCNPGFPQGIKGNLKVNLAIHFAYAAQATDADIQTDLTLMQQQLSKLASDNPAGPQFTFVRPVNSDVDLDLTFKSSDGKDDGWGSYWGTVQAAGYNQSGLLFQFDTKAIEPKGDGMIDWTGDTLSDAVDQWYRYIANGWTCNH